MKDILRYKLRFQKEIYELEDIFMFYLHRNILKSYLEYYWYLFDDKDENFNNQEKEIKDLIFQFKNIEKEFDKKFWKNTVFQFYKLLQIEEPNKSILHILDRSNWLFNFKILHYNFFSLFEIIRQKLYQTKVYNSRCNVLHWKINYEERKHLVIPFSLQITDKNIIFSYILMLLEIIEKEWNNHTNDWIIYLALKESLFFLYQKNKKLINSHTKRTISEFTQEDLIFLKWKLNDVLHWRCTYNELIQLYQYQYILKNTWVWYYLKTFEDVKNVFEKLEKNIDQEYKKYLDQYFKYKIIPYFKDLFK